MQLLVQDLENQAPEQGDLQQDQHQEEMDLQLSLSVPLPSFSTPDVSGQKGNSSGESVQQQVQVEQVQEEVQQENEQVVVLAIPAIQQLQNVQDGQIPVAQQNAQHMPFPVQGVQNMGPNQENEHVGGQFLHPIQLNQEGGPEAQFNIDLNVNMFRAESGHSNDADPGWAARLNEAYNKPVSSPDLQQLWARFFSMEGSPEQRKIKMSTPLVETRARRSPRIRSRNAGFKHTSCNSRNCLACAAVPPTLTTKAMVAIGEDFCKISKEKLSEATLRTKPPTANLIGDKRGASSKRQKGNESIKEVEEGECSATGRRTEN
ncbi:uncharacterized protein LOC105913708 [Setaria italica]|uniref:uncharacterized protein LOC105913708 n=1 Tax=Setaria italica TaxID=4555 RepID=UPI0006479E67|nr:uncharacterized protein LOC105913708 [Setaria italica]